jgi:hypothetical protein
MHGRAAPAASVNRRPAATGGRAGCAVARCARQANPAARQETRARWRRRVRGWTWRRPAAPLNGHRRASADRHGRTGDVPAHIVRSRDGGLPACRGRHLTQRPAPAAPIRAGCARRPARAARRVWRRSATTTSPYPVPATNAAPARPARPIGGPRPHVWRGAPPRRCRRTAARPRAAQTQRAVAARPVFDALNAAMLQPHAMHAHRDGEHFGHGCFVQRLRQVRQLRVFRKCARECHVPSAVVSVIALPARCSVAPACETARSTRPSAASRQ